MKPIKGVSLLLLLAALICQSTNGSLICQNGGTFDDVRYECTCTPNYYGGRCETSFSLSDPCANWSSVQVLRDTEAVHRLGNNEPCDESLDRPCVDFSVIRAGWYRLVSPAGGQLVIGSPTGNMACGSQMPYFLVNQTIMQEDNANRMLSRARAHRYRPGFPGGFLPDDTSYLVRILKCYSALTLYYLQPLPSSLSHYCIGDKQPCAAGLTSIDGTGFEPCIGSQCLPKVMKSADAPQLRLDYQIQLNGQYRASFKCNVFAAFQVNASQANGVLYQIEYELTFRNGTSVVIPRCHWQDVGIRDGENRTFECKSEFVLTRETNVYGGSLACRARAKCNSAGAEYDSMPIVSNIHGFYFRHWFQGGADVIKPNGPASLCIDSKEIPFLEELVTFFVSVGRQQIMLTDRIEVSVIRRDGNESLSCGFKMMNNRYREKIICQDMVLYNRDPDNRIPLGLTEGEQISIIKINISFSSNANGLFTRFSNGSSFTQKIQSIEMKVDLSSLQTNVSTYLHVYTDPWIKPANSAYSGTGIFHIGNNGHYTLVSHKMLPYEIQMKVNGWFATEIAIRYVYYVIRIFGSSSSETIQGPEVRYIPPRNRAINSKKLTLQLKTDGLPVGVSVENVGQAMKIRFDLYGTIIYVWGFSPMSQSACNTFVMSSGNMQNLAADPNCRGIILPVGERIALDVMVVPGFYDTPNLADGLIFGSRRSPIELSSNNLFHPDYQMPAIKDYSKGMQPTEILSICTCNEVTLTSNCFVSFQNTRRERRQASETLVTAKANSIGLIQTRKISQQEADMFCNKFVQLQLSKSVSTDICAETKDPTGKSDYISQFKVICAQYAFRLGTFDFTQSLFNSMLGMCYTEMTYNATIVLGNSSKIDALVEDLCPANCSSRGECLSGECKCTEGFWGTSCEYENARRDEIPIEIQLLQRDIFCSSDSCPAAYLSVRPVLRSTDSVCNIQVNASLKYTAPSVYISGDIVKCELREHHQWLVREVRMFALLQISVTASDWVSNNAVDLLLHQAQCNGRPVTCSSDSMTCRVAGLVPAAVSDDGSGDGNVCLPTAPKRGARLSITWPLLMVPVLTALLNFD